MTISTLGNSADFGDMSIARRLVIEDGALMRVRGIAQGNLILVSPIL